MFYHGGMTLGYLTPPPKAEKVVRVDISARKAREEAIAVERERDQQESQTFITPWHLFY
ncbi:hypothetical protein [Pararhizobium sp. O133]|uniref:hypothetical protein n=1 Tax=Pararhizobium sp. O133 TaxID=3449278 RepID=UPI003F6830BF